MLSCSRSSFLHSAAVLFCTIAVVCCEDDIENQVAFLQIDASATFLAEDPHVSQGTSRNMTQHEKTAGLAQMRGSERYKQTMKNYNDIQYSAEIVIGGQTIDGILDTGSFELLVFSAKCTTCGAVDSFYNSVKSSTHQTHPANVTHTHSFGSGDTWSMLAYEQVEIGPFVIDKQYFWEVIAADMPILNVYNSFQAIVGVGPIASVKRSAARTAAVAASVTSIGENGQQHLDTARKNSLVLAQQKPLLEKLDVHTFSVCLKRGKGEEGYFIWNDAAPRHDSRFREISVIGRVHWSVKLDNVQFNGAESDPHMNLACAHGCAAIMDTGTSVIALPPSVQEKAYHLLNGLEDVSCDDISKFPSLDFELDGKMFRLPPQAYIMEVSPGEASPPKPFNWVPLPNVTICTLGFITMDMMSNFGPVWIIGMPFFREYYTTYHLGDDPWRNTNRSLYAATADADCNPGESALTLIQDKQPIKPMRVDLSKLALPFWLKESADTQYMDL